MSTLNDFRSDLIANAIYILFVTQIRSQYTEIWFDNMESSSGWTSSDGSLVTFGYDSSGCFTSDCLKTEGEYGVDAYAYRSTNVAAYSSLQLQFDVSTDDMESGKTCTVYYAYNSQSNKQQIAAIDPPNEDRFYYEDKIVTLPSASSATSVCIWLETTTNGDTTSSYDRCYWDNVYLRGIVSTVQPTPNPSNPTHHPTQPPSNPTKTPTNKPTPNPTPSPTLGPSHTPTNHPTKHPTTRSPTPPGTMQCGGQDVGTYNGQTLIFTVNLPYNGDIQFDASNSNFEVVAMEAHKVLDGSHTQYIGGDMDHDGIVAIQGAVAGNYKFFINGGTQQELTYYVVSTCTSESPTEAPSFTPTRRPSSNPSISPTDAPIVGSHHPTGVPTNDPSSQPTTASPTRSPSSSPTDKPIASTSPTQHPQIRNDDASSTATASEDDQGGNKVSDAESLGAFEHLSQIVIMAGAFLGSCGCLCLCWYIYVQWKRKKQTMQVADTIVQETDNTLKIDHSSVFRMGEPVDEEPGRVVPDHGAILVDLTMPPVIEQVKVNVTAGHVDYHSSSSSSNLSSQLFSLVNEDKDVGAQNGEGELGQCIDCSQYKTGHVYEGDGMFYCDQCWVNYDEMN
eukprot:1116514_1